MRCAGAFEDGCAGQGVNHVGLYEAFRQDNPGSGSPAKWVQLSARLPSGFSALETHLASLRWRARGTSPGITDPYENL